MAGTLKVNLAYNDTGSINDGDPIIRNAGMNIFNVGDLVEEGQFDLSPTGSWPVVFQTGTYNANETGVWAFIRNNSDYGPIKIEINLTAAERSGADYEWVTLGKLKGSPVAPGTPGLPPQQNKEFIWVYLGGPNEIDGTTGRGIKVTNQSNETVSIQYGIFSRP